MNRWERVDEVIDRVEQTLIVTFLGFMILLAFLQIVLRNFFTTGLDWGDSTLKEPGSLDRFHRGYPCHQRGKTYQHRCGFEMVALFRKECGHTHHPFVFLFYLLSFDLCGIEIY